MDLLERQVNLVILLLEARVPITFEQIRARMGEAYRQGNLETAKRMFERDKDALRDLGIPLDLEPLDALGEEAGYRIDPKRYRLPAITFAPEELAALVVASRGGEADDPANVATRKLLAGADGAGAATFGFGLAVPDDGVESLLLALADAVARRRSVTFRYRTADGTERDRTVDPFGLVVRSGSWYLVGNDRERGDVRAFRLSRFAGAPSEVDEAAAPPPGFRAAEHVEATRPGGGEDGTRARIAFSSEAAWSARSVDGARVEEERDDGWQVVSFPPGDPAWLAAWVLSFGADAEALEPAELRDEVVARLEALRG